MTRVAKWPNLWGSEAVYLTYHLTFLFSAPAELVEASVMGLGMRELVVILLVVLVVFGAKKLRTVGSDLGHAVRGLQEGHERGRGRAEQPAEADPLGELRTRSSPRSRRRPRRSPSGAPDLFEGRFSEILIIFVLALIVLGPEKLPRVVSEVGRWLGRARAMARQFREQLEEEVQLEEARKSPDAASPPPPAAATAPPPEATPPSTPEPEPPSHRRRRRTPSPTPTRRMPPAPIPRCAAPASRERR